MGKTSGFTLVELVLTMIILGIVSVGFIGFINIGSQIYSNVTVRDQLISDGRFVSQRIGREIQHALPNSVRINDYCIEYIPVKLTSVYLDIPLDSATSSIITIIDYPTAQVYQKSVNDRVVVYPTNKDDGYKLSQNKAKKLSSDPFVYDAVDPTISITLDVSDTFESESPNETIFIVGEPVSYCLNVSTIERYDSYGFQELQPSLNDFNSLSGNYSLMAQWLDRELSWFSFYPNSGLIKVNFAFNKNSETLIFNHGVNIFNVP